MKPIVILLTAIAAVSSAYGQSQTPATAATTEETIYIAPLFDYPSAPADIDGLDKKSDWLMEHFWDGLDTDSKSAVDQAALEHAFGVYVTPMRWASRDVALASVDRLLKRLRKNPSLLLQMTMAAEESLYGPRATMWIDEVYERFLRAAVTCKKIPQSRKTRFEYQLGKLERSAIGAEAPAFEFHMRDGKKGVFYPENAYTIIEFGDPGCDDCRMARLAMEADAGLTELLRNGRVGVYFISGEGGEDWSNAVAGYPQTWTVGVSEDIDELLDLRLTPSFYVIGPDKRIMLKNVGVREATDAVKQAEANNR